MRIDIHPGLGGTETGLETQQPRIYTPAEIFINEHPGVIQIKDRLVSTNAFLPVELEGKFFPFPVVPVLDREGKDTGLYICWLDPYPLRNKGLADAGSLALSKLLKKLPPAKEIVHTPPTGKSEYMSSRAIELASNGRKFCEVRFSGVETETMAKVINWSPKQADGIAAWYHPVTAMETGKGMLMRKENVEQVRKSSPEAHVILDDVVSLGRTAEAMAGIIAAAYKDSGQEIDPKSIPTIALAIEVQDRELNAGYKGRPNVYSAMVIPEMTSPIVKTSFGTEIDLREHFQILR